jgi:hypothetical protein
MVQGRQTLADANRCGQENRTKENQRQGKSTSSSSSNRRRPVKDRVGYVYAVSRSRTRRKEASVTVTGQKGKRCEVCGFVAHRIGSVAPSRPFAWNVRIMYNPTVKCNVPSTRAEAKVRAKRKNDQKKKKKESKSKSLMPSPRHA